MRAAHIETTAMNYDSAGPEAPLPGAGRRRKALQGTAYHEAGHAVVAYVLRIPLAGATIRHDRESGFAGSVFRNTKKTRPACSPLRAIRRELDEIDVCLAGPLAQSLFNRRSVRHWQSTKDFSDAIKLARMITGEKDRDKWSSLIKGQMFRTECLLLDHWGVVGCVADALLEHRTINGHDLIAVIKHARKTSSSAQYRIRQRRRESDHLFELFHRQVERWSQSRAKIVIYNASVPNGGQP